MLSLASLLSTNNTDIGHLEDFDEDIDGKNVYLLFLYYGYTSAVLKSTSDRQEMMK